MKHVKAMIIKFISTLAVLYVILGLIFDMSFGNVFLISLILGIAAYVIGDLLILPRTNNLIATIADFGLAFFIIWALIESVTTGENSVYPSFIAAISVALFELLFHRYMANNILESKNESGRRIGNLQYQTEASEELAPNHSDVRNTNDNKGNQ
ncbi:YndM family protein [Bacillus marasmi]|uniref:YndM family protein n=1 Tax=Bacillus marasmi TaxID=1926279 RepID=UPI0011C77E5D|nr:YndM family protein [Bacillus marasmi]